MASPSPNPRLGNASASPRPATAQLHPSTLSSQPQGSTAQPIHDRQTQILPLHRQHQRLQTSPEHLSLSSGSSGHGPPAAPISFTPFFTLIADATTGEHHHPAVHYLFADDDPDLLSETLLRRLDPDPSASAEDHPTTIERHLLIDIGTDGRTVVSAQSLAPDWQVLDANVSAAPTFHGDAEATAEVDDEAGLLLRVDGVGLASEGDTHTLPPSRGGEHTEGVAGMLATVERLRRDVQVLRRLAGLHGDVPLEGEEADAMPMEGPQRKIQDKKDADG